MWFFGPKVKLPCEHGLLIESLLDQIRDLRKQNNGLHDRLLEMHGFGFKEHMRVMEYRKKAGEIELEKREQLPAEESDQGFDTVMEQVDDDAEPRPLEERYPRAAGGPEPMVADQ